MDDAPIDPTECQGSESGRRRTGKIARLPIGLKTQVNLKLRDGLTYDEIAEWLNGLAEVRAILIAKFGGELINRENIRQWRMGGYADWLAERDRVDEVRELAVLSADLADASGGQMAAGPLARATGKLMMALEGASNEDLPALVEAITAIRKQEIDARKLAIAERTADQKAAELALATDKFQRQTAEMFLKFAQSKQAQEILSSGKPKHVQAKLIQTLMFGDQGNREPAKA